METGSPGTQYQPLGAAATRSGRRGTAQQVPLAPTTPSSRPQITKPGYGCAGAKVDRGRRRRRTPDPGLSPGAGPKQQANPGQPCHTRTHTDNPPTSQPACLPGCPFPLVPPSPQPNPNPSPSVPPSHISILYHPLTPPRASRTPLGAIPAALLDFELALVLAVRSFSFLPHFYFILP